MSCCKTEKEMSPVERALAERHAKQVAEKERQDALDKIARFNKLLKADLYMQPVEGDDESIMYGYINAFNTNNKPISKNDLHNEFVQHKYITNPVLKVAHIKDIKFNTPNRTDGTLICNFEPQHEFIPFKRSIVDGEDECVLEIPFTVTYFSKNQSNIGNEEASLECILLCIYNRHDCTLEFIVIPANDDHGIHTLGFTKLDLSDISVSMGIYTDYHPLIDHYLVPTSDNIDSPPNICGFMLSGGRYIEYKLGGSGAGM